MDKEIIDCASCDGSITVTDLSRAKVMRRAQYLQGQGTLCDECKKKKWQTAGDKATLANETDGLPALVGSPDQIRYGNSIRQPFIFKVRAIAQLMEVVGSADVQSLDQGLLTDIHVQQQSIIDKLPSDQRDYIKLLFNEMLKVIDTHFRFAIFRHLVEQKIEASWWIDHAGLGLISVASSMHAEIFRHIEEQAAQTPELQQLIAAVNQEALLMPPNHPISPLDVVIRLIGDQIQLSYPEKFEPLRTLMRTLGFSQRSPGG